MYFAVAYFVDAARTNHTKSTAKDRDVVKDAKLFIIYNNDDAYFHTGGEYIKFWMSDMSLNILNTLFGLLREASYKVTV